MPNLIKSASRTAGTESRSQRSSRKQLLLNINVTAITDTPSVDVWLENYAGNDQWVPAFKLSVGGAALTAVGTRKILIREQIGAVQNSSYYDAVVEAFISNVWRVRTIHADGDAITYSVDCTY